jgi:zinc protease
VAKGIDGMPRSRLHPPLGMLRLRPLARALALACLVLAALLQPLAARDALPPWPAPADGALVSDPAVVWGRLPNGLRYAVMPNRTPPGRVSLRLMIEAGSMMEDEDERGLAHFLEHMAFKGSTNMAPGELVHFLQRSGLAFGPDTNAQTSFETTVYQLDLPSNAAGLVGEGLGILSEIEGRLLIARDQIEPERGVILSEKRLRDTPDSRSFEAMLDFLLPGSRYALRLPIGREEVIRTAPRERFVDFYRGFYTPERSVVVVTGDVQPGLARS